MKTNEQLWISVLILGISLTLSNASWGTPGSGQYHIQTDEGPERYFRFQTDNGQYRKEKRLQDGTVIGTDAWIDAAGYLRSKDYIADNQGYRILKSKTVYVGQGQAIEDAIRSTKHLPAQSGTLAGRTGIRHSLNAIHSTTSKPALIYSTTTTTTLAPPTTAYIPPSSTFASTTATPSYTSGYAYPTPQVFVRHHAHPVDDNFIHESSYSPSSTPSSISTPSQNYEPPFVDYKRIRPIAIINTTPAPITANGEEFTSSTPASISSSTPYSSASPFSHPAPFSVPSTTQLPVSSTSSDYDDLYNSPVSSTTVRPLLESSTPRSITPINGNDLDVLPLYTRSRRPSPAPFRHRARAEPLAYNNNLGSGYDPQYDEYDGVAVTRNGFRYYLPKQYHEEENIDSQRRAGSFGYVDPFGIRRVVYYNSSPEKGFVHRKNNRYVGHHATPYDPRPL